MLIPNLRAVVARELCRIGGFGHLWARDLETPSDEFSLAIGRRNRPRILVLASLVYIGKGDITLEDLVSGLSDVELSAVCELLQAAKGGAAAIEEWARRWASRPAPRERATLPEEQGEFRLEPDSSVAHRRSR